MKQKTDRDGFVKEMKTGAVLSTDTDSLSNYKKMKQKHQEKDKKLSTLEKRISILEDIISKHINRIEEEK